MKRGNDNAQMRREEVEALNDDEENSGDEGEERGTFKRASADVLAGRKIVKIRRSGAASSAPSSTAPAPTLSFGGFGGASTANGSVPAAVKSVEPAASSAGSENERAKKIKKLNESFLKWAAKQIETHPLSIWKEGVKDYIKHYTSIEEKYGAADASSSSASGKSAVAAVPAAVPAAVALAPAAAAPAAATASPFSSFSFNAAPAPAPAATTTPSPFASFTFGAAPAPAAAAKATTAAPAASLPSFAPAASTAAPAVKLGDFKFGAAPAAPAVATTGFAGFGAPAAPSAATNTSATNSFLNNFSAGAPAFGAGGFAAPSTTFGGFGSSAMGGASAPAAAGGDEEGEGGDDEGEPILEPEKVLRNSNDTDEILHEVPCKLYGYSAADKEWKDTGKGTFRITLDPKSQKQRMLVRNQIGRINFNASFFKGMKVEQVQKKIKFAAFVTVEDSTMGADGKAAPPRTEMKNFMIQLKAEDVDATLKKMQSGIASVQ